MKNVKIYFLTPRGPDYQGLCPQLNPKPAGLPYAKMESGFNYNCKLLVVTL